MKQARFPFVLVRDPEGGCTKHHEDKFYDDLTRDPNRRTPWRSQEDQDKEKGSNEY